MINLEHSEKILDYSKTMKKPTIWIIVLSALTLGFGLIQIFIKLLIIEALSQIKFICFIHKTWAGEITK